MHGNYTHFASPPCASSIYAFRKNLFGRLRIRIGAKELRIQHRAGPNLIRPLWNVSEPVPPNLGAISAIETAAFSIAGISVASGFASKYSISIRCNQTATPDAEVWGNSNITDGSAAIAVDSLVPGCKHEITIASFCVVEGDPSKDTKSEDKIVYQCTSKSVYYFLKKKNY